jgi:uncharacterized protein YcfL
MKHYSRAFALLLLPMLFAGCNNNKPVNTSQREEPLSHPTPIADKRIVYDQHLEDIAAVTGIRQATVSGDILKIQVDVTNQRAKSTSFNYKFEWYDPQGMMIETPLSTWQQQTIEGHETVALTAVAPTPTAKDFKLKLQQSKTRLP